MRCSTTTRKQLEPSRVGRGRCLGCWRRPRRAPHSLRRWRRSAGRRDAPGRPTGERAGGSARRPSWPSMWWRRPRRRERPLRRCVPRRSGWSSARWALGGMRPGSSPSTGPVVRSRCAAVAGRSARWSLAYGSLQPAAAMQPRPGLRPGVGGAGAVVIGRRGGARRSWSSAAGLAPAWARLRVVRTVVVAGGVEAEARRRHERVAGVGVDGDPPPGPGWP